MSYRRRYSGFRSYESGPTTVTIHWSNKSGAYAIKFNDTRHWDKMQICIQYIKNFPYGERDYDPDNKTWFLVEKHISGLKQMLELMPESFTVDWQEKPSNTPTATFVPMEVYLNRFKDLAGEDISKLTYDQAKKIYRRACMLNHPDRNGGDGTKMSSINEAWSNIEQNFYKMKKEVDYATN